MQRFREYVYKTLSNELMRCEFCGMELVLQVIAALS